MPARLTKFANRASNRSLTQFGPIVLLCFFAVNCGMFNAAHRFGNWTALRIQYGPERVAREHLEIVKDKNEIIVSNGDELPLGIAAIDRIIMVAGWALGAFALLILIFHFLLPVNTADLTELPPRWGKLIEILYIPALALSSLEFFYVTFGPLIPSEIIAAGTVIGAVTSAWVLRCLWGSKAS